MNRNPKGVVKVTTRGQMLVLILPRNVYLGQKKLALGIPDSTENRKFAELKAKQIEMDLLTGNLDISLTKYKPTQIADQKLNLNISLPELYEAYINSRRKLVSPSTWKGTYKNTLNHLTACPHKFLRESLKIRDWMIQNRTLDTSRRVLIQINAACEWALEREIMSSNPFKGKTKIKGKTNKPKIHPFSCQEKEVILEAFEKSGKFSYLSPIAKFFFLTGCRTSEAIALQWKHIKVDRSEISFEEAIVITQGGAIRKQGTKQGDWRTFPCNPQLQELLTSLKQGNTSGEQAVFVRPDGSAITYCDLRTAWYGKGKNLGIVKQLAIDGAIECYRPQYNTRHTFISQCLEAGTAPTQIAQWVGNSAEIIFRNYAGIVNKASVPRLD